MSEEKNQNEIEEVTNEDEHKDVEHYCYLCRRPESVAGKMLELPNNIFICTDCMQRTLNSMGNGQFGFIDARNMDLDSMDITKMMNDMQSMQPKAEVKKKKKDKKEEPEFTLKDIPAPHQIKAMLDEYVIGQDYAKKVMSVAVYNHYKRVVTNTMDEIEIDKSNMLMIGPTGSGKTYLVKTLARLLKVPLAITDATSLTEAGYIGDDVESVLSKLLQAADNDVDRAEHGIVFIDEIDKISGKDDRRGGDVSREGVQRDLLPLIEGTTVNTKHGAVKTDHILFICSGAFHLSKPSDLLPELQGRLPIRVELKALTHDDFVKILTEPEANLIEQYIALLGTENFKLEFEPAAIDKIADISVAINENVENIGARRLHTVLEILLEDISFSATDKSGETEIITAEMVEEKLHKYTEASDLSKFIL